MSRLHPTQYKIAHVRDGRIIWLSGVGDVDLEFHNFDAAWQEWGPNDLADEGEQQMLDVYLRGATAPTSFYFGLATADPGETGTLATISEVSGTGYARIAVARNSTDWPTLATASGDYQATSASKTFTAGASWTGVTHLFLTTVSSGTSGKLIAYKALGATRNFITNDTLAVTMAVKLS